jgi:2-polyprenyl-3-methyl-5-hydroxy-6-metoxy-1,4-benzoquinol methylase
MPRNATIYRVLIASPSDVSVERKLLKEVIFEWNASHSVDMGILFEPVLWESHVYPNLGGNPQEIINSQIVHDADLLIGVFWTRVGTETENAESGTIEEIQQIVESLKPALIYFSNKQTHPDQIDFDQYESVMKFKSFCSKKGIINTYSEHDEFKLKVTQNLSQLAFKLSSLGGKENSNYKLPKKIKKASSSYSYTMDKSRLRVQADLLTVLDKNAIDKAVSYCGDKTNIKVLDVGCADGYVTTCRFLEYENLQVTGVDISEEGIESAKREFTTKNFSFLARDVESHDLNIGSFDIIFSALTMHHLKNPEGTLHRLWAMLNSGGVLLIRGADDGCKLNYPFDEDLDFLLNSTNSIIGSSDRIYGRKIYTHMTDLIPKPTDIQMEFDIHTTVGMSETQRMDYYDDTYSFRANYAKQLASKPSATKNDIDLSERLYEIIDNQRHRFKNETRLFSLSIQNIGLAYKP